MGVPANRLTAVVSALAVVVVVFAALVLAFAHAAVAVSAVFGFAGFVVFRFAAAADAELPLRFLADAPPVGRDRDAGHPTVGERDRRAEVVRPLLFPADDVDLHDVFDPRLGVPRLDPLRDDLRRLAERSLDLKHRAVRPEEGAIVGSLVLQADAVDDRAG